MKILRLAFIGLVAGFILSILAGRSVWLEMRVNTGLLLPLTTAVTVLAGAFFDRQVPAMAALGLETVLVVLLLSVFGGDPDALAVIPASSFKEGFFLHTFPARTLNGMLAAVFLLGNAVLLIPPGLSRQRRSGQPPHAPRADRPPPSP